MTPAKKKPVKSTKKPAKSKKKPAKNAKKPAKNKKKLVSNKRKPVKAMKSPPVQPAAPPELLEVSRQLALLALAHRDGPLSHRQKEELRRALATAGEARGWARGPSTNGDHAPAHRDVVALAKKGVESLERDLAKEWADKQTEMSRLGEVAAYARKLAADPKTTYPTDITYSYTVRDPYQSLITKTATNTVNDADEALSAAEALEKSIEGRTKLTDLMVIDLEQRRRHVNEITRTLPDFVEASRRLIEEVMANLS